LADWDGLTPPYATIVADPPWDYGERGVPWYSGSKPSYSLLPIEAIASLAVNELAALDAHLYLWAVLPLMAEAFDVVRAWGFRPDTVLTWCKPGPGLGAGFRGNTEHLIVARRGEFYTNPTCASCGGRVRGSRKCECERPVWKHNGRVLGPDYAPRRSFQSTAAGTWYEAPRGTHSEKPALFADLIEQMSPGPYLELFARAPRLGWDSWGRGYEMEVSA
jgi:N6-adenosine-specific RNA methylase IME4